MKQYKENHPTNKSVAVTSEDGNQSSNEIAGADQNILNLLDYMDNYLILVDSVSSSVRQGWLELASARYSMGASRVNSSLFDLKSHYASTTLQVDNGGTDTELPCFTLCKWTSSDEAKLEEDQLLKNKSDSLGSEKRKAEESGSPVTANNHAEKERFKSLSMFGTLVSPKLRATQSTFETTLETLVEMSNLRASLLCAYDQVQKDRETD
ncbi:hypothetical protein ABFS82_13G041700 [Erythranthe guttata]|uniref:coiled-coil domain-containing protein 115-like isoform X2 n=1 Tax=Erythranthe guttata TaxID=4155 RepID=UPI00064DC755|nr:PREDICTED: coiled-coil domain-containing protein 115-like isoform X2 [Erythranthe guttata]XP_012844309.1 PREDICTED: coiled-coil domain-containing protein 115-like isoform X2 [Erythranthe guttata]XP_012844310.1 PREDICTED: coiled-coil domain-containing protein 115-like isoform X2 [Erythranthe guttata]|eukprot:XP_012844308.1 PREDICTED: coiled-coil domain-containing protein 115-like isoform X2 [Erythranthe guttata]